MYLNIDQVMNSGSVKAFFKRATGRDYTDRETCVNDIRRLLLCFSNEREIAKIVALETQTNSDISE